MDFFFIPDLLNRPGPYGYTIEHFLFIVIAVIVGVALAILLRKCQMKTVKIVIISLWTFLVAFEAFKWIIIYTRVIINPNYLFSLENMLPLHSCSLFMYVFPFAIFSKNEKVKTAASSFLVTVNMIMGFITMFVGFPGKYASVFSFFGFHTLLYHAIIFIVPLIMVVTEYYKPQKYDVFLGMIVFAIFGVPILTFDIITGCDYMYFYDGHTFGVFAFIYENVPHFSLWTLLVTSCYLITAVATHYLILGIKYLITKNKKQV